MNRIALFTFYVLLLTFVIGVSMVGITAYNIKIFVLTGIGAPIAALIVVTIIWRWSHGDRVRR